MKQTKTLFWKKAETDGQMDRIQRLYLEAFPKEERKPFELIMEKQKEGITEILSLEDEEGNFYGLGITILHKDIVLLDYFAVEEGRRGKGTGSAALHMMQERSRGKRFILEIENTDAQAENHEQRIRRKEFYLKNGMKCMGYLVELVGVEMEVLVYDSELTYEEYQDIYDSVYPDRKLVRKVR